jgi:hypothetical protein
MIEDKRLEELLTSDDMTNVERNELLRVYRLVKDAPCGHVIDLDDEIKALEKSGKPVRLVPDTTVDRAE